MLRNWAASKGDQVPDCYLNLRNRRSERGSQSVLERVSRVADRNNSGSAETRPLSFDCLVGLYFFSSKGLTIRFL